jgi:hypothetical protein
MPLSRRFVLDVRQTLTEHSAILYGLMKALELFLMCFGRKGEENHCISTVGEYL